MNPLVAQYVDQYLYSKEAIYDVLQTRLTNYGAYSLLYRKSVDDIKKYQKTDFVQIFNRLYSTQRQGVYNDLIAILDYNETSGLAFFKGIINRFLRSNCLYIEELYHSERDQIKYFSKNIGKNLKFGRGTISQMAHFCRPELYPIYNTKSKEALGYLYNTNVIEDNMIEFTNYANDLVGQLKNVIDTDYSDAELNAFVHEYRYILLDDFIEFAYAIMKQ